MPGHASTSTVRPNIHGAKVMICIWWDKVSVEYYELFKPSKTITGDQYRMQLMRLSLALKEKQPQYQERHDKIILQHDNTRSHVAIPVKTYLETLKWKVLPHPPYFSNVAPSTITICFDRWRTAWLISISALMKKSRKWIDSWIASKDGSFF